jgi:hypothetical protein
MPLFLTILEGPTAAAARPIMAINDPQILAAVRDMMHDRLVDEGCSVPRSVPRKGKGVLRLAQKGEPDAVDN